jgi:hypothetical protein
MDARLEKFAPEARALLELHLASLRDLPGAFRPLVVRQLRAWEGLFPPERDSLIRILGVLARSSSLQRETLFRPLAMALPDASDLDPVFEEEKLLDRYLRHFKKEGAYQRWRIAVDEAFQSLASAEGTDTDPSPTKLVFVTLGEGTDRSLTLDDPDKRCLPYFWNHIEPLGTLFTSFTTELSAAGGMPLVVLFRSELGSPQIKVWGIDTGASFKSVSDPVRGAIWFSFEQLRPVMDRVTRKIAATMVAGISGPEALYTTVTDFKIEELGLPRYEDARIRKFIEQVVLQGSGALVINNTFAEWAAVQALRRVEPDLLMVRFGLRRRFIPLRQLDPFQSDQPESGNLPAEDPAESLQDADILTYYIWLETRKNPRFRDRTYFLIHLEGSRAALLVGPGIKAGTRVSDPAGLVDIATTIAGLLGVDPTRIGGSIVGGALATG